MMYMKDVSSALAAPIAPRVGVLLTNVGSPDAPTAKAVRPYLAEFLGDKRVVEWPGWLWKPLLHGVLLNTRPRRSARLYQKIWTEEGSPLVVNTRRQVEGLRERLNCADANGGAEFVVEMGMRYGNPSIAAGLGKLRDAGCTRLLILPMYPQYSQTTTGTSFDAVFDTLKQWRWVPEIRTIGDYHTHPAYVEALARSIEGHWRTRGRAERILFSYHGIPEAYVKRGDPYQSQCYATSALLAERLDLKPHEYGVSFQSRLGPVEWLRPYTDQTLEEWGHSGLKSAEAICPGFSADCLETVDEVAREGKEAFEAAGGGEFTYIPALNANSDHIEALARLIGEHVQGWVAVRQYVGASVHRSV